MRSGSKSLLVRVLAYTYGMQNGKANATLIWEKVNNSVSPETIAAAKNADAVITVVGITSQLEGEEMPVASLASLAETAPASICRSPRKISWKL